MLKSLLASELSVPKNLSALAVEAIVSAKEILIPPWLFHLSQRERILVELSL